MKPIDTSKLQSDMDEHGYSRQRLAGILRRSHQTVNNILNRGTASEDDIEALEAIFDKPKGYYTVTAISNKAPAQDSVASDELINLVQQFNTNVFSYQMSHDKELKLLNETALTLLAAVKDLQRSVAKLEGVSNNNTSKITTTIAKVRVDTEAIKGTVNSIDRELKS